MLAELLKKDWVEQAPRQHGTASWLAIWGFGGIKTGREFYGRALTTDGQSSSLNCHG